MANVRQTVDRVMTNRTRKFWELGRKAGLGEEACQELCRRGYFVAPASKGHHLAFAGGLREHSMNVAESLVKISKALKVKWERPEGPYLVGLLHDLVKCDCYKLEYKENSFPDCEIKWCNKWGDEHGSASVKIAAELGITLWSDEIAAITYHMGLYSTELFGHPEYSQKDYETAMKKYAPHIIATHTADMYASHVLEEEA